MYRVISLFSFPLELNLSSCDFKDPEGLVSLRLLKKLQVLNLYRIPVRDATLVEILKYVCLLYCNIKTLF